MPSLKYELHALQYFERERSELRPAMVDRRRIDRAQYAIRDIGRAGNLQEMPSGMKCPSRLSCHGIALQR